MSQANSFPFQAEVSQVLHLVINSLCSHKEVFLRELISNASDALDKLRFESLRDPELVEAGQVLKIRIVADKARGTLTISDNGIGMSKDELSRNLGTVAFSGSRAFVETMQKAKAEGAADAQLIGQFGVGFYSAYLVATEVEVVSRPARESSGHSWKSEGRDSFTIEPASRDERGTSVVLHLKPDCRHFLDDWELRELVRRYSDYINYPIELGKEDAGQVTYETINRGSALWQRNPSEVTKEQYHEFFRHLTHEGEPLAHRHFRIEGTQMFSGLLFIPRRAPFDLHDGEGRHGIRLHVRRVFVMDDCKELAPRWLRFVRGVVDSEDLPLNVSREMLQDSRAVRIIKKQVVSQTLDCLETLAREQPDDYRVFWEAFGAILKEGLHFDPEYKERLAELIRFESTSSAEAVSLRDYVARMPADQPAIYYVTGLSRAAAASSPHLEALRSRGYEVLLLVDPVDPFAVESLTEYQGKKLVSAMTTDLGSLPKKEGSDAEPSTPTGDDTALFERVKKVLEGKVGDVRASERLTESPVCLVVPEGGLAPHVERMLRAQKLNLPERRRIFELNLTHPAVQSLRALHARDPESAQVKNWIGLLYDQALLAEGSPIEDPARFARQVAELLTRAAGAEAQRS